MKKYFKLIVMSILAGMMIAIGGIVYLSAENKVVGSFLFSIGLLSVCFYQLNLYTGKVGYLIDNFDKGKGLLNLIIIWFGNLIGTFATAQLILHSRRSVLSEKAVELSQMKLDDSLWSIFILGIFCGVLMYIGVETYKQSKGKDVWGVFVVIFCVMVFILSGFEHCIANMFYITLGKAWSMEAVIFIGVNTIGNGIGSIGYHLGTSKSKEK